MTKSNCAVCAEPKLLDEWKTFTTEQLEVMFMRMALCTDHAFEVQEIHSQLEMKKENV